MWNKIKPYVLPFAVSIAIPIGIGALAALITKDSMDIFGELTKPPLTPPALAFPIVWTVLYILMGIGSALVYIHRDKGAQSVRRAFSYYAVSLVLNFSWSIVFFNARSYGAALVVLLFLLYYTVRYTVAYFGISRTASLIQIPYILWIAFAGYLNAGIIVLNI